MIAEAKATLAFLRADLAAMEVDRGNLIREIARIEKKYGGLVETTMPKESQVAKSVANGEAPVGRKGYRKNSKGEPSIASLIAEAGEAQPGPFSLVELRRHLDVHHQDRSAKLTNDDLSKQVYIIKKRGQFTKQTSSSKGGMHTYIYNRQYSPKK